MDPVEEDRYEAIELIVKVPTEGDSWADRIFDFVAGSCGGTPYDEETDEDGDPCTCGLESMGGMTGTLDQCFAWETQVGKGLQPIDLARTIIFLVERANYLIPTEQEKVVEWAKAEIAFEAYFENKEWENEEDDEG